MRDISGLFREKSVGIILLLIMVGGLLTGCTRLAPIVDFTFSPANPSVNQTIQFTNLVLVRSSGGAIDSWSWDFGDGNTIKGSGTVQNPVHRYASAGSFTVKLIVKDSSGEKGTASRQMVVSEETGIYAWGIETVDYGYAENVGEYSSIALDGNGNPHISYYDQTNGNLKYALKRGGRWQIEIVDSAGNVGKHTSIAIDSRGNPHISYYDSTTGALKYAARQGSSWEIEIVDSAARAGQYTGLYTSIALDRDGNPHIGYYDSTDDNRARGSLKYAVKSAESWQIVTVDSAGNAGGYISIALDSNDQPHISYLDFINVDLKYAVKSEDNWQIEVADSTGRVGPYSSIALDSRGGPHISYRDSTKDDLKYAMKNGGSWQLETVDSAGRLGLYTSITLDNNGDPHISYYDSTNEELRYAVKSANGWQIATVESAGNVGRHTSISLDSSDNPHISYYDFTNGELKYAVLSTK